jgi:hypothetical protein
MKLKFETNKNYSDGEYKVTVVKRTAKFVTVEGLLGIKKLKIQDTHGDFETINYGNSLVFAKDLIK